jgi:hypothetical protein
MDLTFYTIHDLPDNYDFVEFLECEKERLGLPEDTDASVWPISGQDGAAYHIIAFSTPEGWDPSKFEFDDFMEYTGGSVESLVDWLEGCIRRRRDPCAPAD